MLCLTILSWLQCKKALTITLLRLAGLPCRGLSQKDKWETNTTDTQRNDRAFQDGQERQVRVLTSLFQGCSGALVRVVRVTFLEVNLSTVQPVVDSLRSAT